MRGISPPKLSESKLSLDYTTPLGGIII
jgi:hypothetical protein